MGKTTITNSNRDSIARFKRNETRTKLRSKIGTEWEKIPADLPLKIQEKLNIYDKTRVYSVCKSWQSMMSNEYLSQQVPWLLLPSHHKTTSHRFFDLVDKKIYNIKKTLGETLYFRGASHGWVVAVLEFGPQICLINPLKGLRKQLPNITWMFFPLTEKYILSSNPSSSDDYFVIVIYGETSRLAYTRCGDDTWTKIECEKYFIDIAFYEEKLYGLTRNLELMHIEIRSSGSQVTRISSLVDPTPLHGFYVYLVKSCIGLLMVERTAKRSKIGGKTVEFHVYKFDFGFGNWKSLEDIGENVFLLGRICSMTMSSKDCPKGMNSNSLYFVDNFVTHERDSLIPRGCLDMGVVDLKTRKSNIQ